MTGKPDAQLFEPDTATIEPETEMKINAIVPWFGSKRTLAPKIVEELGPHRAYWEPFCGSMAVLLAKKPASMETANDLNGELINLARVLADEPLAVKLYGRLSRMLMHEVLFHDAAERLRNRGNQPPGEAPDVDRAYDFFVVSWMGRSGVAGTSIYNQSFCARYTKNGGHAATRWGSAIKSIPAWHERLCNLTILSRNGIELCERIEDAAGVVIYADPPYLVKGAKYIHDFASDDHKRLAAALGRFRKTRVVVSYYEHPALQSLYPGWTIRKVYTTKALVNQGRRDSSGATVAPEVLLINGDPYANELS